MTIRARPATDHAPRGRPLRVGLVVSALDRPLIGVTRVGLELGRALGRLGDCEVVYLTTYRRGPFRDPGSRSAHLPGCARVPGLMLFGGPLVALAAHRLQLDIVHDPVGVSPFTLGRWAGTFRRVLTIHDAIAFRYPEGYSRSNTFLHRRFVPATLRNVDAVITVSEHARAELEHFLPVRRDRLFVVPNGVSERFHPIAGEDAADVALRYGLQGPYALYVGTRQPRKNLPGLLDAFARLPAHLGDHRLALTGPRPAPGESLRRQIAHLGLEKRVAFLGNVDDDDLPALYAAARVVALPSLFEGFGLTVLEAMACGTPVVCSAASSLPEVAGDAALLVDAADAAALADALQRALLDDSLRADLRRRGFARARAFTWRRAAEATLDVYRAITAEAPGGASAPASFQDA